MDAMESPRLNRRERLAAGRITRGVITLAVAALVALGPLRARGQLVLQSTNSRSGCASSLSIDSSCLTRLYSSIAGRSTVLTAAVFNNITAQALACAGAGADAALRPLRTMFPAEGRAVIAGGKAAIEFLLGVSINITFIPFNDIGSAVLNSVGSLGAAFYDVFTPSNPWLLDLIDAGLVQPLDAFVPSDARLDFPDFFSFLRTATAVYNRSIIGLPLSSYLDHMFWRRDVLGKAGLKPPRTWREFLQVAKALNGTDMDGDGQGDYAVCLMMMPRPDNDAGVFLGQVLAPMTQTKGTQTGWLFDPNTMASFVDSPAMLEALDVVRQIIPYNKNVASWDETLQSSNPFVQGKCALHISFMASFKAAQWGGKLRGLVGTAPIPGSHLVLDRSAGALVPCTRTLCPYAKWEDGVGINYASYSAYSAGFAMVNANTPGTMKAAAFTLTSLAAQQDVQAIMTTTFVNPSRYKHLCATPACLRQWEAARYNATDAAEYLAALRETADSPNNALAIRIPNGAKYKDAFIQAMALLVENATRDLVEVQATMSKRFAAITAETPLQKVGDAYLAGLNLGRRFIVPPPPPPPPVPAQAVPPGSVASSDAASGGGTLSKAAEAGVITAACVGAALIAVAVAMVLLRLRSQRRRGAYVPNEMPGPGPSTTLVVTDIEDSTVLWETLPAETMNKALNLHNKLVHELLSKHNGHEAAMEGDSVTAAFGSPWDALAFAQELQLRLLALPWPEEVLAHHAGAELWVTDSGDPESTELWGAPGAPVAAERGVHRQRRKFSSGPYTQGSSELRSSERDMSVHLPFAPNSLPHRTPDPGGAQPSAAKARRELRATSFLARMQSDAAGSATLARNLDNQPSITSSTGDRQSSSGFVRSTSNVTDAMPAPAGLVTPSVNSGAPGARSRMFLWGATTRPVEQTDPGISGSAPLQGAGPAQTVLDLINRGWSDCTVPLHPSELIHADKHLALRGLRVRVGLHSGLSEDDVAASQEGKGRVKYVGRALAMAKAMCDSGHGGMVLLSEACHAALVPASGIAAHGHVLHLGECRFDATGESAVVYMAVAQDARARLALLLRKPLRGATQTQPGALRAPAGAAAVAFVNVVGAASLSAWDGAVANRAFAVLHKHARHLLTLPQPDGEADGYAVKMHEGLCLCSFHSALAALLWSTHLVNALRLLTEWEPALLAHELCEEVAVTATDLANAPTSGILSGAALLSTGLRGLANAAGSAASQHASSGHAISTAVLFRGLRLKVGLDVGHVHATIVPSTGRVDYRGRVMNRAARIAAKAQAGQVWATRAAWELAHGQDTQGQLECRELGPMPLKGVAEAVQLVHVTLAVVHAES